MVHAKFGTPRLLELLIVGERICLSKISEWPVMIPPTRSIELKYSTAAMGKLWSSISA